MRWIAAMALAIATLGWSIGCSSSDDTTDDGAGEASTTAVDSAVGTGRTLRVPGDHTLIQDAVDAAAEGDLILIDRGVYPEGVTVETPGLTIRGMDRNEVVLDGGGTIENGVAVFSDGVNVENLTVRNFRGNGVFFTGGYSDDDPLSGFAARYVTAHANGLYGIYAFGARGGIIENTYTSGHPDAGLYVGQCFPCETVLRDNIAEFNQYGFQGANAGGDLYVVSSTFRHNRVGIQAFSTTREKLYPQRQALIVANRVTDNVGDRAPASSDAHGTGIVIAGGRDNRVDGNLVTGHPVAGITIAELEQFVAEFNEIIGNTATGNAVDLAYVNGGGDTLSNCFGGNTFESSTPVDIQSALNCAPESTGGMGTLAVLPVPPPVEPSEVGPPPAQPSMGNPDTADAAPASAEPPAVDESTLVVPAP